MDDEVFTLEDIRVVDTPEEPIYCIRVDAPHHEFLIGRLGVPTHNSDDAKAQQALRGEAQSMIGSIARLGRAGGVHLMVATQRPDAKLLPGELKANLGMRLACGQMNPTASAMTLDSSSAVSTPGNPKGRAVISVYGHEQRGQIYFVDQSWIDGWLDRRGLNQDGTPKTTGPSAYIDHGVDGLKDGNTLDDLQGVDNSEYIARTQAERESIAEQHAQKMAAQGITSDMPGLPSGMLPPNYEDESAGGGSGQNALAAEDDDHYHIGRPALQGGSGGVAERPEDAWDESMDLLVEAGNDDSSGQDEFSVDDDDDHDRHDKADPDDDQAIDMDDFNFDE
jgi:hypothetical protein